MLVSYFKIRFYNEPHQPKGGNIMNKLQLLLDVVKTMNGKESLAGTFKAEGSRDQVHCFYRSAA